MRNKKEYEYKAKCGFLTSVKITTTEEVQIDNCTSNHEWFDARYIEVLLMLDVKWRTLTSMRKFCHVMKIEPSSKIHNMFKALEEKGLIESRKEGNKHKEYRRAQQYYRHAGVGNQ